MANAGTIKSPQLFRLFCLVVALCNLADAKAETWYKYENGHFEAYSSESERITRNLLVELENYRAAVLQAANIEIPQGAPKAQIYIFATEKEFKELIGSDRIGGFALSDNGVPHMVLPVGRDRNRAKLVVRHEYAHILLAYKRFPYPIWFQEGFAELMSATEFLKKGTHFSVGNATGRGRSKEPLTPWSELISEAFDPHAFENWRQSSDAYLQSWFLTHYFLLGNEFGNVVLLEQYLSRLAKGEESVQAFEAVIGMPANQFGDKLLREYSMQYVTYRFLETNLDHEFQRTDISNEDVSSITEKFRDRYKK